jgi:hypothetical protein
MQLSFQHGTPTAPPGLLAQRVRLAHAKANADAGTGLGQTPSVSSDVSSLVAAGASVTTGILGALSAAAVGGSMAGPIGLAIAGVAAIAIVLVKIFSGCGQTCVEATAIANQVEPVLLQNLQQYMAAPVHYASLQAAALNNFNTAWQGLVQGCGSGALATTKAGENCIANRQQGSCAYKTSPGGWQQDASGNWSYVYPGANGSGTACWDWFIGYYDPIANDPTVVPDPVAGASSSSSSSSGAASTAGSFPWPLLIVAGLVAWAMEEA